MSILLHRTQKAHILLPDVSFAHPSTTLPDLTGQITRDGDYYFARGGFADVWKGIWVEDRAECKVCLGFFWFVKGPVT
jgi:hypothetical protein